MFFASLDLASIREFSWESMCGWVKSMNPQMQTEVKGMNHDW